MIITIEGSLIVRKAKKASESRGGGKRGKITKFSDKSRLRMLSYLHTLVFEKCLLLTLTYDADYPSDCKDYHGHLGEFRKAIEDAYNYSDVVWKLEFQKRGAPHFHLIMLGVDRVSIPYLSGVWHRISGCKSAAHLAAGFDVKRVSDEDGIRNVGAYVCKYVSKLSNAMDNEVGDFTGRYWGHWGGSDRKKTEIEVSPWDLESVLRSLGGAETLTDDVIERFGRGKLSRLFVGHCGSDAFTDMAKERIDGIAIAREGTRARYRLTQKAVRDRLREFPF
jgi:hypothetical protein